VFSAEARGAPIAARQRGDRLATVSIVVSRSRQRLVLPLDQPGVEAILDRVSSELGWTVERAAPDRLQVNEDATRLHCHCAPLEAGIRLTPTTSGETEVRIEGRVPGWGPVSAQHVREQTELLARRIGLALIHGPGSA
jgi:hypothetical protein